MRPEWLKGTFYSNILHGRGLWIAPEKYETINVRSEKDMDWWDFRPLFKRLEEFEKEGWVVFSSNEYSVGDSQVPTIHFLLRREKE